MVLSAATIRRIKPVSPFVERSVFNGKSYGLSIAGYDIRVDLDGSKVGQVLESGDFKLFGSIEEFDMPKNIIGFVKGKSSWARQGVFVNNTVIEPGWKGFLTIEIVNHGYKPVAIYHGDPIAQIIFQEVDTETDGYSGKYQNQERGPQEARYEGRKFDVV